ncbi:MAG: DUF1444 family protein [Nibricoccus sp.]
MNSTEYTAQYAKKLTELYPQMQVTVSADLELSIKVGDTYDSKHWLDNSFFEYRFSPQNFDEIVARYGKAALPQESSKIELDRIVPVIKDTEWIRETNAAIKASSGAEMIDYVKEDICDGLVILYAQDRGETITYLHVEEVKKLGLSLERLHTMALKNLQGRLQKIERHDLNGVYYYTAGGTYESSLILYPWIWGKDNFELAGQPVFAVPTRDVLIITSSDDQAGIGKIRSAVEKIYANKPSYRLTGNLFHIANGKILPFENPRINRQSQNHEKVLKETGLNKSSG